MKIAARISERSVAEVRSRAEHEVAALLDAAFAVLGRAGIDGLTVGEVLTEAGLSTRAFYRHFRSKDELVLALFASESERANARRAAKLTTIDDPLDALDTWIALVLALAYEPRQARRTRVLQAEGARLRHEFPAEFGRILDDELDPLRDILQRGLELGVFPDAEPATDAPVVHALVWSFAQARLDGSTVTISDAQQRARRYVERALGADHVRADTDGTGTNRTGTNRTGTNRTGTNRNRA